MSSFIAMKRRIIYFYKCEINFNNIYFIAYWSDMSSEILFVNGSELLKS